MAEPGLEPRNSVCLITMMSWVSLRNHPGSWWPKRDAKTGELQFLKLGLNHKCWFKNKTGSVAISLRGSVLSLLHLPLLWGVLFFSTKPHLTPPGWEKNPAPYKWVFLNGFSFIQSHKVVSILICPQKPHSLCGLSTLGIIWATVVTTRSLVGHIF